MSPGRAGFRAAPASHPSSRASASSSALSVMRWPVATFTAWPVEPLRGERAQVAVDHVRDVGEVAALPAVAVDDGRAALAAAR